MKIVYPQLSQRSSSSSSGSVANSSHTNRSVATSVAAPALPSFKPSEPADHGSSTLTPKEVDLGAEKPSKSKGKFKQRREHSPADDSDLDIDFDTLDVRSDEGNQCASGDETRSVFPNPSSPSSPSLYITQRKGGDGDNGKVKLGDAGWVTNYEYKRLQNIGRNNALMRSLGIPDAVKAVAIPAALQRSRVPVTTPAGPPTRIPPGRASKQHMKS